MRYLILLIALFSNGLSFAETYTGNITLEKGDFFDKKPFTINHSSEVICSVKFFAGEFVGNEAIFAYTKVKNPTDSKLKYAFHVAFFDASENLIAVARHTTTLKPGVDTQLGGMYSEVKPEEWKNVTSYKFTVTKL
ncbi:MAG: hypothetical protein KZQ97_18780 [Candidatus Thiodiazotropha sp. (ex Dulcina madagascariensis)]|nr:hypothetical protein [Candidatus Thiodiazotropha sp. (ex Dulcina madagascariensis)]